MFEIVHQQLHSARWWFSRRQQIDMNPIYQRKGNLWKLEDRQSLIDSMINGYDIPKLYFADFTTIKSSLNDAGLRYAVIDGKQRLQAIFDFLSNEMPLSDEFELEEDPELKLAGLYYKDVVERAFSLAERVDEFPLPIVHVVTDDPSRIRKLFLRLNKGLTLTGPEKRSAMVGDVPQVIAEIAAHEFFSSATAYKANRGEHLNNAAKILAFELHDQITETKKINLDQMVKAFAKESQQLEFAKLKCIQNLDKLSTVFGKSDRLLRSAGSVPAFYWFVRGVDVDRVRLVRSFLDDFSRELARKDRPVTFSAMDLDTYKSALRNINDKQSHGVRVDILENSFGLWLSNRARVRTRAAAVV